MNRCLTKSCRVFFSGTVWVLLFSSFGFPQEKDQRLEKIFSDWDKRHQNIQLILYKTQGTRVIPKGSFMDDRRRPLKPEQPSHDISCKVIRELLLDFRNNRHRLEVNEENYEEESGKLYPVVKTTLFDGAFLKQRNFNKHQNPNNLDPTYPDIGVASGDLRGGAFEAKFWPYFIGHGILVPIRETLVPGHLKITPKKEMFSIHGQGVVGGRPCLVLRTAAVRQSRRPIFDEFWVDTERDSAVVRQIFYSGKLPVQDTEIQYQKTSKGWLPKEWTYTLRDQNYMIFYEKTRVEQILLEPSVSDEDFQLKEEPRMLITKTEYGPPSDPKYPSVPKEDRKYFRVAENGKLNEVEFKNGVEYKRGNPWVWWTILLLFPMGIILWFIWRRKETKPLVGG